MNQDKTVLFTIYALHIVAALQLSCKSQRSELFEITNPPPKPDVVLIGENDKIVLPGFYQTLNFLNEAGYRVHPVLGKRIDEIAHEIPDGIPEKTLVIVHSHGVVTKNPDSSETFQFGFDASSSAATFEQAVASKVSNPQFIIATCNSQNCTDSMTCTAVSLCKRNVKLSPVSPNEKLPDVSTQLALLLQVIADSRLHDTNPQDGWLDQKEILAALLQEERVRNEDQQEAWVFVFTFTHPLSFAQQEQIILEHYAKTNNGRLGYKFNSEFLKQAIEKSSHSNITSLSNLDSELRRRSALVATNEWFQAIGTALDEENKDEALPKIKDWGRRLCDETIAKSGWGGDLAITQNNITAQDDITYGNYRHLQDSLDVRISCKLNPQPGDLIVGNEEILTTSSGKRQWAAPQGVSLPPDFSIRSN